MTSLLSMFSIPPISQILPISDEILNENIVKKRKEERERKRNREKNLQSYDYCTLDSIRCDCCSGRYYKIKGKTSRGIKFSESVRLPEIGSAIRKSGIDMSHWDEGGFFEVVIELIVLINLKEQSIVH